MKNYSRPALDLLDEATRLLRNAPASALLSYCIGSVPFVLFFLYYWAEMSSSVSAPQHLLEHSLLLALLYIWMKIWNSVFASLIDNQLTGAIQSFTIRRWIRIALIQGIIQPSALFLLPLSFVLFLPFGWMYAFYRNVSALGNGDSAEVKPVMRAAWSFAQAWPGQNHRVLSILLLFSIAIFVNVCVLIFTLPGLLRSFFGIETDFSRSGFHLFNTTLLMAAIGVSYFFLSPFSLAVYVLRCFYSKARHSGADLKIELALARRLYE